MIWVPLINNSKPSVKDIIELVDRVALHIQYNDNPEEQSRVQVTMIIEKLNGEQCTSIQSAWQDILCDN